MALHTQIMLICARTSLDSGLEDCFPWRPETSVRAFRSSSFSRRNANTSPSLIIRCDKKKMQGQSEV